MSGKIQMQTAMSVGLMIGQQLLAAVERRIDAKVRAGEHVTEDERKFLVAAEAAKAEVIGVMKRVAVDVLGKVVTLEAPELDVEVPGDAGVTGMPPGSTVRELLSKGVELIEAGAFDTKH